MVRVLSELGHLVFFKHTVKTFQSIAFVARREGLTLLSSPLRPPAPITAADPAIA